VKADPKFCEPLLPFEGKIKTLTFPLAICRRDSIEILLHYPRLAAALTHVWLHPKGFDETELVRKFLRLCTGVKYLTWSAPGHIKTLNRVLDTPNVCVFVCSELVFGRMRWRFDVYLECVSH